jgi:hypothetical protein
MRRSILVVAMGATIVLAACGGGSPASSSGGGSGAPSAAAPTDAAPATGDQFGGDICSALTKDEVVGAAYPQGKPTFDTTDTQKDEATGKAVVCQYLASFGGNPSTVAVAILLMDDSEYANRDEASLIEKPSAVPGVGSEAWLVRPAPGLFEVWVTAAHGRFKVATQSGDTSVALAKLAAPRD